MPDALSLLSLVSGATSALVSLVTSVVSSIGNTISAVMSAGRTIVGALVKIGASVITAVSSTITAGVALGKGIVAIVRDVIAVGSAIGKAIGPLISGVVNTISAASKAAGAVIGAISGGIGAVSKVIGSVISTVSSFFSSISSAASVVTSVVGSVVSSISGVIGPVVSSIGSLISSTVSVVSGAVGAFTGIVSGAASGIMGAVTSIIGAVTSVVGAITSSFQAVSQALGQVASVAGSALSAFAGVVQSCVESLMSFASNVTSITAQTGMSISAASNLTTSLGAVGISGGEVAKIFGSINMRPEVFNARSAATGLAQIGDPNFASNEAKKFQDLVKKIGYTAAKSRLDAQFGGQAPEQILRVVNMDPAKLRANEEYGKQVQSQLGVGPNEIKAASEDLPLLMDRVSTFVDAIKMRFAADLLPSLEAAFSVVSNVLKDNAGTISGLLQTATKAIFVDGPDLAANAALTALDWGSALVDMFLNVADAGITLVETFGNRDGALYGILLAGAQFVDFITGVSSQIKGAIAFIQASFENGIYLLIQGIITAVMGPLSLIPGAVDKAHDAFDQLLGFKFEAKDPAQAYKDAVDNGTKFSAVDALNKGSDFVKNNVDTKAAHANIASIGKEAHAKIAAVKTTVTDVHDKFKDNQKNFSNELAKQQLDVSKQQLDVNKQHLDATKAGNSGGGSGGQIVARMGAYLAQDAYRLTSR